MKSLLEQDCNQNVIEMLLKNHAMARESRLFWGSGGSPGLPGAPGRQ